MTLAKFIKLLLMQFLCVFIVIQVGLVSGGFSFFTILILSFILFSIIYLGFIDPRWQNK
ncbi:hypothetical protein KRP69_12175 [Mammaliicoccus sciuri]|uniref:hypothetical protein n=1 Tax=Mammaliicoccus sciuri TaxID=1296 RepID=UPI001D0CECF0|nr:hypothetical protein [Mammaliicoccus sciuri]MCC2089972.1 hypothetical protein [Mammaliicoccus sciuri]